MFEQSRRNFLKASSLAAVGAALVDTEATAEQANTGTAAAQGSDPKRPTDLAGLVNILQGTDSDYYFSRGNTLPIAALPFGMAHWTLQSRSNSAWMFQPGDRRIQGFRCTHQLSPWLSDYGHAIFMPFSGEAKPEPDARSSSYRPEEAMLAPHSLRLKLLRCEADVELVPTTRCCLLRANLPDGSAPGLMIEIPGATGSIVPDPSKRFLRFESRANSGGVPENFAAYYTVYFKDPWDTFDVKEIHGARVVIVHFKAAHQAIEARIATSFISFEQARRNLDLELGAWPAAELRARAADIWNEHLGRIEIGGASDEQRRTFYSCMYRALLFPRTFHEPDENGKPHHYSAFNGKVEPGVMYADHGYWDVYRAWYPFMSLVFPERLGEILQGWVNAYHEGGWMPQFPAPGYRACMSGSLIDSLFADAVMKDIAGFDRAAAYEGLRKHATQPGNPDKGYGRQGIEYYLKMNYLPADHVEQSVAETADAAYGDFCIAQIAAKLGKQDDATMFLKRSQNWRNIFDAETKFFRGRNQDGSWLTPFDPFQWGSPYEEGAAWQHRWNVPHDVPGLITAMGGDKAFAAELDKMLALPPTFHVGVYGQEIHEMSEMAALPFGQYMHNNQPVHHVLYLFAAAGRADRTQYWVRRVLNEAYSPANFSGDEDTGSMAAWYILSALGFYPVCPGKPEYTLGSPLFPHATIHLANGKTLDIDSPSNSAKTPYVNSVTVNSSEHRSVAIDHAALANGARIRFQMSDTPVAK
ncbi:GH92 family glycosyl hydrolase [Occallatibacter riparius]|uniref:GH92 family glycosyl hydrolase n=1 Tax=Occallatibacter riparius TaxID=1002689 RepID=A0A9J7BSC5_9BACT|nr:GH92 family glycosyl hydrolase [Occallatibacter riparius]UWZ85779.1 GH92 family glycosyl hydrolase [Occallatibacter riparius]